MQAIVRRNQTKASQPLLWVFRVLVVLSVMDDVKDFTGWTGNRRGNIFASAFSLRRNNGDQENSFFDHVLCALPFKRFCSPSYAAKQWIKGNGYNENDQQLYAMVDFYFSTRNTESSGPLYKKGWLDESNPCWWEGVICGFTNEIESIQLGGIELEGTIPSSLGYLTKLESLYLQQNQLSDQIPSELGQITALSSLYLNGNNLSGVVPTEICGDGDWGAVYTYITADCGGSQPEVECKFPGCCSECFYF